MPNKPIFTIVTLIAFGCGLQWPEKVWPPNDVFFPDFTLPATRTWWIEQTVKFRKTIAFDGLWIDMNEPSNFVSGSSKGCSRNSINYPPFVPAIFNRTLHYKTLCPDFKHHLGMHYDVHNLYGWSETEPTQGAVHAATGRRGMVLSRSTYVGSGRHGGHWLGDNFSIWSNLYYSVIGMLEFNLFGIPFVGADICGFNWNTTYELCVRWMQLGAFYPFSRNHNDIGQKDQDPGVFGAEAAASSRAALMVRYTLLPYLYTLFYHAHVEGSTVTRALFHEFPTDAIASNIDRQFLWGAAFMVSPVLDKGATFVNVYFPNTRWFSYYTGEEIALNSDSVRNITVDAPLSFIPLHVRGGYILPTQQPANCTMLSRKRPLGLLVVLDELGTARGDLFWDDGESIGTIEAGNFSYFRFHANTSDSATASLIIESVLSNGPPIPQLQQIIVYGLNSGFRSVTIDGALHRHVSYNTTTMAMFISDANITMPIAKENVTIRLSTM